MYLKKYVKNAEEIKKITLACELAAETLSMIKNYVKEGVSTEELNIICHKYITEELKSNPSPLNYHGYPKSICTSINNVVCHGIPNKNDILKKGDILNIDVTVDKDGFFGDSSCMFEIGEVSESAHKLCQDTLDSLYLAILAVRPGQNLKTIGKIIQKYAHMNKYSVVEDFCGHGIGSEFHEKGFQVLHYDNFMIPSFILEEGMTFTIEPMLNYGKKKIKILSDKWTAVTQDGSLSAQWEHTILVTSQGHSILTKRKDEEIKLSKKAENFYQKNKQLFE